MMLPTHVLAGMALLAPLAVVAPEAAPPALAGAVVGGVLPDLDLYAGHRRTLHYPTWYAVAAVPAVVAAALVPVWWLLAPAGLLVAAALHCRMDRFGGGLELRPWEGTSERAVYDHAKGRWLAPRRWVRYDGAPEDVVLAAALGVPLLAVLVDGLRWVVAAALVVGVTYGLLRRRLADVAPVVFSVVPERVDDYVPDRYQQ